ncbi:MAG TPA: phosphoribosylamine--glycine ligase [Phycisphaerales bacterium]|nr:phosphoribosylamine--glycine ligase [Phycisphaerales bacterium]
MKLPSEKLNVLLIGGAGREHALAWKLKQSRRLGQLFATHTTNPGIAGLAQPIDHDFSMKELYRLQQFIEAKKIQLVVVGPEDPLAQGIVDKLSSDKLAVFGPTAEGAQLESNKAWAKRLMRAASIPTAESRSFTDPKVAKAFLESREEAYVIKASGLAAGKGVVVASDRAEGLAAVDRFMIKREFGDAGAEIVIEERLKGPEVSVFALTDGRSIFILDSARDHKRLGENDTGPNTGGMGAFSPAGLLDERAMSRIEREVLVPVVDALRRDDITYRGLLYAGLMLTHAGPKVLEFNCRFGDPECQTLMPRLKGDLVEILYATATGQLEHIDLAWDTRAAVCIVLCSSGYPGEYKTGFPITGLEEASKLPETFIFHAGTKRAAARDSAQPGVVITSGGRVVNVVALGDTIAEARTRALAAADVINFEGKTFRRDIAAAG